MTPALGAPAKSVLHSPSHYHTVRIDRNVAAVANAVAVAVSRELSDGWLVGADLFRITQSSRVTRLYSDSAKT